MLKEGERTNEFDSGKKYPQERRVLCSFFRKRNFDMNLIKEEVRNRKPKKKIDHKRKKTNTGNSVENSKLQRLESEMKYIDNINSYYVFLEYIGKGSIGKVHKCRDLLTNEIVVIKIINKKRMAYTNLYNLLMNEKKIHNMFSHRNIIHLIDIVYDDTNYYIIQEYGGKYNLYDFLTKRECSLFDFPLAQFLCAQLVEILTFLRVNGIVHRDLKLQNLLIDEQLHLKLIDFNYAFLVSDIDKLPSNPFSEVDKILLDINKSDEEKNNNTESDILGTLPYLCPEVLKKEKKVTYEMDLWAFGCIVYRFFHEHFPFSNNEQGSMIENIMNIQYEISNECNEAVADFIRALFRKNKFDRLGYKDINELRFHPIFENFDFSTLYLNPIRYEHMSSYNSTCSVLGKSPVYGQKFLLEYPISDSLQKFNYSSGDNSSVDSTENGSNGFNEEFRKGHFTAYNKEEDGKKEEKTESVTHKTILQTKENIRWDNYFSAEEKNSSTLFLPSDMDTYKHEVNYLCNSNSNTYIARIQKCNTFSNDKMKPDGKKKRSLYAQLSRDTYQDINEYTDEKMSPELNTLQKIHFIDFNFFKQRNNSKENGKKNKMNKKTGTLEVNELTGKYGNGRNIRRELYTRWSKLRNLESKETLYEQKIDLKSYTLNDMKSYVIQDVQSLVLREAKIGPLENSTDNNAKKDWKKPYNINIDYYSEICLQRRNIKIDIKEDYFA